MSLAVTTNARQVASGLRAAAAAAAQAQHAANVAIALHLTRDTLEQLGRDVYAPAPAGGRPRTGRLFAADRWVVTEDGVRHQNTAPHYLSRWRYGKPGGRPAVPPRHASSWHRVSLGRNIRWILATRQHAHLAAMRKSVGG